MVIWVMTQFRGDMNSASPEHSSTCLSENEDTYMLPLGIYPEIKLLAFGFACVLSRENVAK